MIRKVLFIGFFTSLLIISCKKGEKTSAANNADTKEKADYVTFSGEIAHPNSDSLIVYNPKYSYKKKISVHNGKFSDTLHIKGKGRYTFYDGVERSTIYLKKGYHIHLNMDAEKFDETIKYKGEGAEANNYMAQFCLMRQKTYENSDDYKNLSEVEVSEKIKNIRAEFLNFLNNYKNLDSSFVVNEKKFINSMASDLIGGTIVNENNELFGNLTTYKNLNDKEISEKIKNIRTKLLNDVDKYKTLVDSNTLASQKEFINLFVDNYKNNIRALAILKANKEASPLFANYENIDGSKTSLKDLRGKYVYIDVWATWCPPCKDEIPYLKELQQKYRGRNITFVSISVDALKYREKWIKMVKEEKLGGIQLLAKNSWKSNFITEYKINGIPRFILIDPQGKIVSPDTYRPSEKENIEALFTSLNI